MTMWNPEKLKEKDAEISSVMPFQFLGSLLHFGSRWWATHAQYRMRVVALMTNRLLLFWRR